MKLAIFDIDGTITSDNSVSTLAFEQAVKECFGILNYSQAWENYTVTSDVGIIREICKNNNLAITWSDLLKFQTVYYQYFECFSKNNSILPIDGAIDFINNLYLSNKHAVLIITGGFPQIANNKLINLGICDEIPRATAFDGLSRNEILSTGINRAKCLYNCEFDNYILFGDSKIDINLARERNMFMIGVSSSISSEDFRKEGVVCSISSYYNNLLDEVIRKWQL